MLLKNCAKCGRFIPYGQRYCPACQEKVDKLKEERRQKYNQKAQKKYNSKRDPKYITFYRSKAWRMLSAKRLQDDGFRCRQCRGIATEVDHIIPIQTPEGWDKRLDYDNTQSLCTRCHNEKHHRFIKKKNKK